MNWLTAALAATVVVLIGVIGSLVLRARHAREQLREGARHAEELAERLRHAELALCSAESAAIEREQLAAIGELSAMIAHEIRNPLTIIGNAIATLRRKETALEDRTILLGILEEEAARLNRFMTDLLSYARPVSLELVPVDLREIVERALALVPERAGLEVELVEAGPAGKVMGDANLLRQVFENLVNNAAQAMGDDGGVLTVRIAPSHLNGTSGVDILVEDTGEGMDTSVRDRALLPFFTTRPSGTGLGLAIVARFVQAHGGKLEIRSSAGKGTSVRVFLPHGEPLSNDVGKSHPRMRQLATSAKAL